MSLLSAEELESIEDPFAEEGDHLGVIAAATVKRQKKILLKLSKNFAAETTEEEEEVLLKVARNSHNIFSRDVQMETIAFALKALFTRDREKSKLLSAIAELVFQNTKMRADIEYADAQKENPVGLS
eukprot:855077_1